ncbi:MAG: carboxypeptidase-like regulatory domain-containing protein [Acidobacteriaceae bacterium]
MKVTFSASMLNSRKVMLGMILLIVFSSTVLAQTSTGEMSITVFDPAGAVVPGATISIKGSDTGNIVRTLQANGEGLASISVWKFWTQCAVWTWGEHP